MRQRERERESVCVCVCVCVCKQWTACLCSRNHLYHYMNVQNFRFSHSGVAVCVQDLGDVTRFLWRLDLTSSVSKDRTASIFRIKLTNKKDCLTLMMNVPSKCREPFTQLHSGTQHVTHHISLSRPLVHSMCCVMNYPSPVLYLCIHNWIPILELTSNTTFGSFYFVFLR